MLWEGIKLVFTILWLRVCFIHDAQYRFLANDLPATSGACATIASDALMNPFDGMNNSRVMIGIC